MLPTPNFDCRLSGLLYSEINEINSSNYITAGFAKILITEDWELFFNPEELFTETIAILIIEDSLYIFEKKNGNSNPLHTMY